MESKRIRSIWTDGICYIEPVPGATSTWYFGMEYTQGDLYEAEEIFRQGRPLTGNRLCLVRYPEGEAFFPLPKTEGHYCERPVYLEGSIYMLDVDFPKGLIRIMRFDCSDYQLRVHASLPLSSVKDCYNLQLRIAPLTLARQRGSELEIVWPEKIRLSMDEHDSFFMRDGDRLFFNRWHEEGEGERYRFYEETVIRDLEGRDLEVLSGDILLMPDGQMWHLSDD